MSLCVEDKLKEVSIHAIKKIISLGTSFMLMFSISAPAFAANVVPTSVSYPHMTAFFVYTNRASSTLSISNGKASIRGYVQKAPSGKNIELTSALERYSGGSWSVVESWSTFSTSSSVLIAETCQVSKGKYRVATDYVVGGTSGSEANTVYSRIITC